MPYNPGIQYIGGQLLGQGIQQAAQGLTAGLERYAARKDATEQMRAQLAGPQVSGLATYAEAPGAATTPNGLADSMGTPEGPNEGTGEGNATEAEKKVHKLTKALRDIGEHGYGYSRPVVDSMGYNELTGLVRREEKLREQRQDALVKARLIQEAQHQAATEELALKQFGLAQAADKRAAELAAVMLPYHKLQTAGLAQAQEENDAQGKALAAFSRGGTNVSPVSYADWAARSGLQLGGAEPPVGSTPFTYEDRVNRALQTPGLGGNGAVKLLTALERFAPKQMSELDAAHAAFYRAQAAAVGNPEHIYFSDKAPEHLGNDLYRVPSGPNASQIVYMPKGDATVKPIVGQDGQVLGMGLPNKSGLKPLKSDALKASDVLRSLESELKLLTDPNRLPSERAADTLHIQELRRRIEDMRRGAGKTTSPAATGISFDDFNNWKRK